MDQIIYKSQPPLLKATDVAVKLNVSKAYVYKLIKTGDLPSVQIGSAVRVRLQDLWEFIEANLTTKEKR
ncbi:MAG: helix-turn-helix domain-containing protein [Deltaproteobacteria bacterium]|nr:helix-turn-helix domain-containing protein [Deltaproteobacteria bacterium]